MLDRLVRPPGRMLYMSVASVSLFLVVALVYTGFDYPQPRYDLLLFPTVLCPEAAILT
jgi:hypothetical protein